MLRHEPRLFAEAPHALLRGGLENLEELFWPTRCVGCDLPGELVCAGCRKALPWIDQRWACPVCGAPFGWLVCTECGRDWELRATISALSFAGAAARLVTCYKDQHEKRLAPVIAAAMLTSLDEASAWPAPDGCARFDAHETDAVCFVPATAEAFARRGFDHMEGVARTVAGELGLPLADILVRANVQDQRALGRAERAENLAGSVVAMEEVRGLSLLLLDDVITTGASMRESARALLERGAADVTACSVARVW